MRPAPQEIITGVCRILKETVAPHVSDEYAANRLREVWTVLGQVDWNDSAHLLGKDNDAIAGLLVGWRDWVGADASRVQALAATHSQVTDILAGGQTDGGPFAALAARNAALGAGLAQASAATSEWARGDAGRAADAAPILTEMLRHYSTAALRERHTVIST